VTELDAAYQAERLRLANTITAATAAAFGRSFGDRAGTIATIVPLVEAGQAQTVRLVGGYMAAKARAAGEDGRVKGLDARAYTTSVLRGRPAAEIYSRPFGALGAHLARRATVEQALTSARGSLSRLVRTDLQLSQTHAARDWMGDDDRIVGYERVLGPGKNCPLCVAASTRVYYREDLMPIHERCGCSVAPLFGDVPNLSRRDDAVRVADDAELGPRLLAEGWAA
jgi:hypothetical protein